MEKFSGPLGEGTCRGYFAWESRLIGLREILVIMTLLLHFQRLCFAWKPEALLRLACEPEFQRLSFAWKTVRSKHSQ